MDDEDSDFASVRVQGSILVNQGLGKFHKTGM
jgi:hypothetical protein